MQRTILSLLPLMLGLVAAASGCDEQADTATESIEQRPALVERLRGGGHVLVFRHAATDSGLDTTNDLTDCSRQRNLSSEGRHQSRGIGRALRRLDIPVGHVLASPFCRTRDTARLAFGRAPASRALLSPEFFASPRQARRNGLPRLLATRPRRGTNTVLVSHGSAIYAATRQDVEEGEAVIVDPGRGTRRPFAVVTMVKANEWRRLARLVRDPIRSVSLAEG